jgi:hypothetical protein
LAGLPSLERLDLSQAKVTDRGLGTLKGSQVEELDLSSTVVGDAGLRHLVGLPRLKLLNIESTRVTPEAMEAFRESVPSVKIQYRWPVKRGDLPDHAPAPPL